jgi:hypothetical protein
MARPITWTDVAYRGNAAAIEMFGRGGDRLAQGIKDIGQVAVDNRNQQIKTATDAAIADIALSQDPAAAAAAAPQDWTIDPLAIAKAASGRTKELKDAEVVDATLKSTNKNIEMLDAQLKDREDIRQAADMALPYRDLALNGKPFEIDKSDPRWQTVAGQKALDTIDGWSKDHLDNKIKLEEIALRREAAAAARADRVKEQNGQNALSEIIKYYATPEGLAEDEANRDETVLKILERNRAPLTLIDTARKAAGIGLAGNMPSQLELDRIDPKTGTSARAYTDFITKEAAAVDENTRIEKSKYDTAVRTSQLLAPNPYKGMGDEDAAQAFIKKTGAGDGWLARDWDTGDFKQRVQLIQDYAKENFGQEIKREEAYFIVESTLNRMTPFDSIGVIGDNTKALIADVADLNAKGGREKVEADLAAIDANASKDKAKLGRDLRLTAAAASSNNTLEIPKEVRQRYENNPGVKRDSLQAQIGIAQQSVNEYTRLVQERKINGQVLVDAQRQLAKLKAELARLQ